MKRWGKKAHTVPGRTFTVRSGYEAKIAAGLDAAGVALWSYEPFSIQLEKAGTRGLVCGSCGSKDIRGKTRYTPDFVIDIPGTPLKAVIEAKGRMTAKDRKTILAFSKVALEMGYLYFVLIQRDNALSKGSKTRYSDWLTKNGITYAVGTVVPPEWYTEAP